MEKVGLAEDYEDVWQKVKTVNLPSYIPPNNYTTNVETTGAAKSSEESIRDILYEHLIPAILADEPQKVSLNAPRPLYVFDNSYIFSALIFKCMHETGCLL